MSISQKKKNPVVFSAPYYFLLILFRFQLCELCEFQKGEWLNLVA